MDKDPFFASGAKSKRKARKPTKFRRTKREKRQEVLGDESAMFESDAEAPSDYEEDRDETLVKETAAERRVRMAKQVIKEIEEQEREKELDGELLNDAVAHRLREELDKEKGMLRRQLATKYSGLEVNSEDTVVTRGHRLPVTSVVVSNSMEYFVTASKDGTIIKWSTSGVKLHKWARLTKHNHFGHKGAVLCMALDNSDKILATGGDDSMINLWNFQTHEHLKLFRGHRGNVNGLAFRKKSLSLFSASDDRTVKVWDADALTYVETLYGHQDGVLGIDAMHKERALSCGGRDRSLRLWKIVEESQLLYAGRGTSMDCVAMLSEYQYITGNQNGSISLWDMNKKKAMCTRPLAHGPNHWIASLAAVPYADIFASGSCDGFVRVWGIKDKNKQSITPLFAIPEIGWVTSLSFSPDGTVLVAGVGKEHRLGRWDVQKAAKNGGRVYMLEPSEESDKEENDTASIDDEGAEEDELLEEEESEDDNDSEEKTRTIKGPTRIVDDEEEEEEEEEELIEEEEDEDEELDEDDDSDGDYENDEE